MNPINFLKQIQSMLAFKKRKILRDISTDYFGPEIIRIYPVGYLCNNSCPMCWRSNNVNNRDKKKFIALEKQNLTILEYQKILTTLPPGVQTIEIVGGGEPLLFNKIERLTNIIKKNFYTGSLITNGILLRPKMIDHLLRIKFDRIRVSIHASNRQIYKLVNGVDNFKIVEDNIRLFLNKRRKIQNKAIHSLLSVLFVIQRTNYKDIYNFALFAQDNGCDYIEFDTIYPYTKSMMLNKEEISVVVDQLSKVTTYIFINNNASSVIDLYKYQPHAGENGVKSKTYYEDKKCTIPTISMILDSIGHVHPCCFLDNSEPENIDCGDFRQIGDIWTIWRQKLHRKIRKHLRSGKFYKTCIKSCNYALSERLQ